MSRRPFHQVRAPIAAVNVDAAGEISAFDVVGFEAPPDGVLLCCAAGKQVAIVAKAAARIAPACGPDAALAALRAAAAIAGVGLSRTGRLSSGH
jgi:hypothetical protein